VFEEPALVTTKQNAPEESPPPSKSRHKRSLNPASHQPYTPNSKM